MNTECNETIGKFHALYLVKVKRNRANYPNIRKAKLTHEMIARMMGYKSVWSFRKSSAHKRIMEGIDEILKYYDDMTFASISAHNGRLVKKNGKIDIELIK